MRVNWTLLRKRAELPALGAAISLLIFGAYFLCVRHNETNGDAAAAQSQVQPPQDGASDKAGKKKTAEDAASNEPAPVRVPSSASGAGSSGNSGGTWIGGDPAVLGAEFRRSVSKQFGDTSLGQAQLGMAGLGFQCQIGSNGRMACEKSLQAGKCTLTWSVSMQSRGGTVGEAGGEGFSRECG